MRGLKKIGTDRFSRFDVYWMETNKQNKQTNKQTNYIYTERVHTLLCGRLQERSEKGQRFCVQRKQGAAILNL